MNTNWQAFLTAVERMREMQKAYFRKRSPSSLTDAKYLEKAVDRMIKRKRAELARETQPELTGGEQ